MKSIIVPFAIVVGISILFGGVGQLVARTPAASVVDAQGNFRVPDGYRTTYQHLGAWAVASGDTAQGSKELHDVYVSPKAVDAYRESADFPDGTVIVKEVYDTATMQMTTGLVSRAMKLKGWFVMVRDKSNAHRGHKLWGDGWGWSWFDANLSTKTTTTDYSTECKGCHVPAEKTHWIYVEGYPALKR